MPVEVLFRGVSLFRQHEDCVEVLIPATPEDQGFGRMHHYSRIVVWDTKDTTDPPPPAWSVPLMGGVELTFSTGSGRPQCDADNSINLESMADLRLKRKADLYSPRTTVASVILKGGSIDPTRTSNYSNWSFNGDEIGTLAYELTWTTEKDTIDIRFDAACPRTLHDSELIMIGNRPTFDVDLWNPAFDHVHDMPCKDGIIRDMDFWWLYRLTENPGSTPMPEAPCAQAVRGAGSPTCFMAWWV